MYRMFRLEKKIECPELGKCNKKLCMLYIYWMSWLTKKLNVQNNGNSTGNCVQYMYRMSRIVYIQNCVNSAGNCVHYICTKCLDLLKSWLPRTKQIQRKTVYIKCTECSDL